MCVGGRQTEILIAHETPLLQHYLAPFCEVARVWCPYFRRKLEFPSNVNHLSFFSRAHGKGCWRSSLSESWCRCFHHVVVVIHVDRGGGGPPPPMGKYDFFLLFHTVLRLFNFVQIFFFFFFWQPWLCPILLDLSISWYFRLFRTLSRHGSKRFFFSSRNIFFTFFLGGGGFSGFFWIFEKIFPNKPKICFFFLLGRNFFFFFFFFFFLHIVGLACSKAWLRCW